MGALQDQRVGQHQGAHGNFDQLWKHSGSVESIQSVGVTQGRIRHTQDECKILFVRCASWGGKERRSPLSKAESSQCSESGPPGLVGAAVHDDLTLIDSSDEDALFVVPRSTALVERGPENESGCAQRAPPVDDGIVLDHLSESETESVELRPRRRLVSCSQTVSLPPQLVDEAGSREGITEMVAEDTDPVPDPLFVPMAGAMAFGLQSLDLV